MTVFVGTDTAKDAARSALVVGGTSYDVYRLLGPVRPRRQPPAGSLKVLLENLLRYEDGAAVTPTM